MTKKAAAPDALRKQYQAARAMLAAKEAAEHLIPFARYMMPDPNDDGMGTGEMLSLYKPAAVHRLIAQALEEVESGKCLRLLLSVPPQHGKSQLSSRSLPAWMVGRKPWRNIMLGTYNQDFANEFGDDVRNLIESPRFAQVFPRSGLRTGSRAKDHMVTNEGGKLSFLGRGGAGTGRPADFFIIDDPIKDAKEAESSTIRNDVWEWFTKVAYTRCHAASAIVIIQTRWSDDDLIGRLTDKDNPYFDEIESKKWTYLNIPALFDDPRDEPIAKALGLQMGSPLWPERFSREHLESAKRLNPTGFSALYQGRPTPPEGDFYKIEQIHTYKSMSELPKDMRMYGSADLAVSPDRNADSSVIGNWGVDDRDELWLLPNLYWEKKAADKSVEQLIDFAEAFRWLTLSVEKGVIDRAVGPFLEKRMLERGVHFHIEKFPNSGLNKAARSLSIRGRMAQGKVHFPAFAPWWPAARDQMLKFTGTGGDREDDFCDMVAQIGLLMDVVLKGRRPQERPDDKVVQIGSFKWLKQHAEAEAKKKRIIRATAGM